MVPQARGSLDIRFDASLTCGDLRTRSRQVYPAQWTDDPERLHLCVAAGAPYGGPFNRIKVSGMLRTMAGGTKEVESKVRWTEACGNREE